MNGNYYTSPPSPDEVRRRFTMQQPNGQQGQTQGQVMGMMNAAGLTGLGHASPLTPMEGVSMGVDGPLAGMVGQNPLSPHQHDDHRMSMMDYDAADAFTAFPFGGMAGLGGFAGGADLTGSAEPFSQQGLMSMSGQQLYGSLAPEPMGGLAAAFPGLDMASMSANPADMGLFNSPDLASQFPPATLDAVSPDFAMDIGGGDMMGSGQAFETPPITQEAPTLMPTPPELGQFQASMPQPSEPREVSAPASFHSPAGSTGSGSRALSQSSGGRSSIAAGTPASTAPTSAGSARRDSSKKDVYSKSGFDMLRALYYVATRKNPTVEIGAVDMSCAFVVCDLTLNDCPIISVSDNFQNLTGYNRHEIVGKNCRFLQSPNGMVDAGSRREFVANDAVFKLKNAIADGKEIQQSLINYRKGGKPFLNLLTMIPIPWDTDEMRYCIGFQIDLVECPDAISGQEAGGSGMQVNYVHSDIGQYIFSPPNSTQWQPESGQSLKFDEVSALLDQFNPRAPPSEWHRQSWDKMLLENTDDVVHVLSLKGLFIYLSPACKRILEYDAADLIGASLSSVCHPSDIVPVTRELKDAQPGATVDFAFRIRRKHSGYTWFESRGTLFYEPAKARKYMILVGRKRPVFSLRRRHLDAFGASATTAAFPGVGGAGGVGDSEVWSKMSASGMFLSVSGAARVLLDHQPADLEGTSMQDLLRKEARAEFGRAVEKARRGAVVALRHEIMHRRGQLLPAYTVFYPGDAPAPGKKPSFLIVQTRVAKGAAAGRVLAGGGKLGSNGNGSGGGGLAAVALVAPFGDDAMSGVVLGSPGQLTAYGRRDRDGEDVESDEDEDQDDDVFAELKTTRCTSWQYELRQMEKVNRLLAEELTQLMASKKKRKRRKGGGVVTGIGAAGAGASGSGGGAGSGGNAGNAAAVVRGCANCHKRDTPEWRRGPSGNRDLCNSCGLRWAKQTGKVSPRNSASRTSSNGDHHHHHHPGSKRSSVSTSSISTASTNSPVEASPLRREVSADEVSGLGPRTP